MQSGLYAGASAKDYPDTHSNADRYSKTAHAHSTAHINPTPRSYNDRCCSQATLGYSLTNRDGNPSSARTVNSDIRQRRDQFHFRRLWR